MPGTTPTAQLRYPVAGDAPDGAGAFYNLAQDVDDRVARTSTATAGTFIGQKAYVGTGASRLEYVWTGGGWELAALNRMRVSIAKSSSQTIAGQTTTDVTWDTVLSDPTGLMAPTDGKNVRCPWAGRYRVVFDWAISSSNIAAGVYVGSNFVSNSGSDYVAQAVGQSGALADAVMSHTAEWTVAAGGLLRVQAYWADATQRPLSLVDDAHRPKLHVQYLGPA